VEAVFRYLFLQFGQKRISTLNKT